MGDEQRVRAHIWVSGRVQGVFFRQEALRAARGLGVSGWVRNLPDGRVEAVLEGAESVVESMVSWAASGPAHAQVTDVELRWERAQSEAGFRVRP